MGYLCAMIRQCAEDDDIEELEEGEWIPDDPDFWRNFSEKISDEGMYYLKLFFSSNTHLSVVQIY